MSSDVEAWTASVPDVEIQPMVVDDQANHTFRVHRSSMTSPEVHRAEIERIFTKSWLYVGHESEIPNPGDFVRRPLAGRPIFMAARAGRCRCTWKSRVPHITCLRTPETSTS